ncbi:MAG: YitT family protein [Erysipelotrichaceae bacterium]|jgi:uncharacterized membrane-anchored protein YitT (DUF2179 family)|nr:YitT family protein [Erysipelotrichaceae bacterium]
MELIKTKKTRREKIKIVYHFFLIVVGSLLLAFGTAIFLTQNTIIAGGISGIGFIVQKLIPEFGNIVDICIWILTGLLWVLSLFTLGKDFALKTLLSTILYPLFYSIFYRVPLFIDLAKAVATLGTALTPTTGDFILNAIFGGITIGFGVALTFVGKGSTGGLDVLAIIMKKYLNINVSVGSFAIDALIILTGLFALSFPNYIVNCLSGIISAFMTALVIEFIYSRSQNAYIMEVISDKHSEISDYIINELDRGVSLVKIKGGFTNNDRILLRSVLTKDEYFRIREFISECDSTAFVTFTPTNAVFGEGFRDHIIVGHKKKNKEKE